jgi:glycerophosphoryl diester phosphodiesterase
VIARPGLTPRPVQVVAHRGASEDAAEHTLAAYTKAIEQGADGLECDVRLTRDGHLVCVHDRRIDRTSDGRGVLSTLELGDLTELDWASWRDRRVGDHEVPDLDRSAILTLERLLEFVADCSRPVQLAIETKHPTRYAGLVERRLVTLLDRFGWAHPRLGTTSPIQVMSFSQVSLRRVHQMAPSLRTVFLLDRVPLRFRDGSLPPGVRIAGPSIEIVRAHPRFVERLHRRGYDVHVWTVDEPADVELCLSLGADTIITNRPAHILAALGRGGS